MPQNAEISQEQKKAAVTPETSVESPFSAFIPEAKASGDILQQFLDDPSQDQQSKQTIMQAIQKGEDPKVFIDYLEKGGFK